MTDRLKEKLDADPDNLDGWRMLTKSLLQQEKKQEAISSLNIALDRVNTENKEKVRQILDNVIGNNDF